MGRTAKSPIKKVESNIKIEHIDTPDVEENKISNIEKSEQNFTEEEKRYISDLISKGYHMKDIFKKVRAYLKISDEKYQRLIKNVRKSSDIYLNMEDI